MMGGFFDGSGPANNFGRYVMAGFVSFCPTWAEIAERWAEVLAEKPAIPKFKLSLSRNPEWRGEWRISKDQMDRKIRKLAALVTPPSTLFSIICTIDIQEFHEVIESRKARSNRVLRKTLGKYTMKTPYAMLFHNTVAITLEQVSKLGIYGDQVDFVFDRENELFDNANTLLRNVRPIMKPELSGLLGDAVQRDEDKVLPLQAADLIAGLSKDQCNDESTTSYGRQFRAWRVRTTTTSPCTSAKRGSKTRSI